MPRRYCENMVKLCPPPEMWIPFSGVRSIVSALSKARNTSLNRGGSPIVHTGGVASPGARGGSSDDTEMAVPVMR